MQPTISQTFISLSHEKHGMHKFKVVGWSLKRLLCIFRNKLLNIKPILIIFRNYKPVCMDLKPSTAGILLGPDVSAARKRAKLR